MIVNRKEYNYKNFRISKKTGAKLTTLKKKSNKKWNEIFIEFINLYTENLKK